MSRFPADTPPSVIESYDKLRGLGLTAAIAWTKILLDRLVEERRVTERR